MQKTSSPDTFVLILIATLMGVAVALLAWLLARAFMGVPQEDRTYRDEPPLGFRLLWLPIQAAGHYFGSLMPQRTHEKVLAQLRQAGMDYCLTPLQFHSARLVGAALLGLMCVVWLGLISSAPGGGASSQMFILGTAGAALLGYIYPNIWLKELLVKKRRDLLKSLPFYLDMLTLCVEAGLNVQGAMQQAVAKGPDGVLRDEFQRVLRDIRAGRSRAESLRDLASRLNDSGVSGFVSAVIQAESTGMNLGPALRAQADQRRSERFLRAEKLAMEAPVKMLFPLIFFIFPCTFIVLFFPVVMQFMQSGL
jgi:tight adherence protein C